MGLSPPKPWSRNSYHILAPAICMYPLTLLLAEDEIPPSTGPIQCATGCPASLHLSRSKSLSNSDPDLTTTPNSPDEAVQKIISGKVSTPSVLGSSSIHTVVESSVKDDGNAFSSGYFVLQDSLPQYTVHWRSPVSSICLAPQAKFKLDTKLRVSRASNHTVFKYSLCLG